MHESNGLLKKIEDFEANNMTGYGLYEGNTGLSIAYFILSKLSGKEVFSIKGQSLIDEMGDNIGNVKSLDFGNGLGGIGWGVEWIVQNNFITANTNEILEEIDDAMYKSVIFNNSIDLSISTGILGAIIYFYRRMTSKNPNASRYRALCNQECLFLLTDILCTQLSARMKHTKISGDEFSLELIKLLNETLNVLVMLAPLNLITTFGKEFICTISSFFEHYFSSNAFSRKDRIEQNLRLVYTYGKAGRFLFDQRFTNSAISAFDGLFPIVSKNDQFNLSFLEFICLKLGNEFSLPMALKPSRIKSEPKCGSIFEILCSIGLCYKHVCYDWHEAWGL